MANLVFNRGRYVVGQVNTTGTVFQLMLVSTGYVAATSHDNVYANSSSGAGGEPRVYEISVSGYTRQTLASLTLNEDDPNNQAYLDANDVTFTALGAGATIGAAVLYRYSSSGGTTGDSGQDLISFYDLTDTPTNGGDITIQWASSSQGGVLRLGTTS